MRNQAFPLLLGAALLCAATPAARAAVDWYTGADQPQTDWIVAVDASASVTSQNSQFGKVTVTGAAADTLLQSGPRVRVEGVVGQYTYTDSRGFKVTGTQQEGAALAGYEWVWANSALAGFVGINVRNTDLSRPDPNNSVVGTSVGAKAVIEYYARPTDKTMIHAYGAYATTFNEYYVRLKGGYALFGPGGPYFGPEVAALGDDFFGQYRVGAHMTGLKLGIFEFGVAAGYVNDRVLKAGFYTNVDARAAF